MGSRQASGTWATTRLGLAEPPAGSSETAKTSVPGSPSMTCVAAEANVVCGNVQTSNATVYLIDSVLMPPATS